MKSLRQIRSAKRRSARPTMRRRKDTGAAAVEFALVLPILLTLVFGIINFGYIFATQISLNNSARDAARAGVVKPLASTGTPKTCQQIADLARSGATTIGLTNTQTVVVTVTNPDATSCTLPKGVATDSTSGTIPMCATTGQLKVVLEYTVVPPIPMPMSSPKLTATGAFQCEYISTS